MKRKCGIKKKTGEQHLCDKMRSHILAEWGIHIDFGDIINISSVHAKEPYLYCPYCGGKLK